MPAEDLPFDVGPGITRADIPLLCTRLAELIGGQAGGLVVCDVAGARQADVVTVEALARLRLVARRHGWRFDVRGAGPELVELVRLLGLADAFSAG